MIGLIHLSEGKQSYTLLLHTTYDSYRSIYVAAIKQEAATIGLRSGLFDVVFTNSVTNLDGGTATSTTTNLPPIDVVDLQS